MVRTAPMFQAAAMHFLCSAALLLLPLSHLVAAETAETPAAAAGTCPSPSSYELPLQVGQIAQASGFPGPPALFGLVASIHGGWDPALYLYDTPMAVRHTWLISALNWNCAAAYSPIWGDALTRTDPLVRAPASVAVASNQTQTEGLFPPTEDVGLHNSDVRFLCAVQGWRAVMTDWVPEAVDTLIPTLAQFGLTTGHMGYREDVGACFEGVEDGGEVDSSCLQALAEQECYSPAVMGQIVGRQLAEYARADGWNQDGKLNKDGSPCRANCHRFGDYTGYEPVNLPSSPSISLPGRALKKKKNKKKKENKDKKKEEEEEKETNVSFRWMPLLEDDGRGCESRQQHVTPHIGTKGKPAALTRAEMNARTAPKPSYNYNKEAKIVIQRLAATAVSDEKKVMIEFFDNKLNVAGIVIEAVAGALMLGYEDTLNYVLALTAGDYDACILAWKEKVKHDLVRPTTWIQTEMAEREFTTYAGPYEGLKAIPGKNFESYVSVMPHSEYVSGSACICQALMELTEGWMVLHDPNSDPSTFSITLPTIAQGSSRTEPGVTPAQDITKVLQNMQELRDICGQSRLDGGMHFTQAVTASYELCEGLGVAASEYAYGLFNGISS